MRHDVIRSQKLTEPVAAEGRRQPFAMAAASGIAVAGIYYNQPMMGLISGTFPASATALLIPTATQLGYAAGLFLQLPLGDLVNRRQLIVGQFLLLTAGFMAAATAQGPGALLIASLFIGANATVAQQIIPVAAGLGGAKNRGRIIGFVMTGLLSGILLSQSLAGFVAAHAGWRAMFWLAVLLTLTGAVLMVQYLPRSTDAHTGHESYGRTLRSLLQLWRGTPALRRATLVQAGLFATYAAFWSPLSLRLQTGFHMGADVAGGFGLIALTGVIAAPLAGLALATAILSFGFQGAMVANQNIVFSGRSEVRSRLNTLFMTGIFLGGSAGAAGAGLI